MKPEPDPLDLPMSRRSTTNGTPGLTDDDQATLASKLFKWCERLVGIDGAAIHMRTERGFELTWAAETGHIPGDVEVLDPEGSGPIVRALQYGVTQVAVGAEDFAAPAMRAFVWKAAVCIPLVVDDRVIGVFSAGWRSPVPISDDMRLILEAAASMSAAVLHRIGLVHDLKREQQRLRNVLEDLPVAASIIDIAGPRVRWRNRQARRFFGDVGTGDAVAATFSTDALHHFGRSGARNDHFRSILMEETTPGWAVIEAADGQRRILSPTIARLDAESSVVIHVDVTREVHIDQERSRFVHMVSHHLRTPLTPLLGYAHLLADANLDPAIRTEAVEAVEASLAEVANLVARLELIASLQPVDPQVMSRHSAGALIDEAWTRLSGADPGDLQVSGDIEALILCAEEHVVEALKEIFANALTYGIPPVEVSVTAGRNVQISVSDAGDGIPVEWETAIFAPFVSARQGYIAPTADHIGLGLNLARGLILATRGELAYSDGAFTIRLQPAGGQLRHDMD